MLVCPYIDEVVDEVLEAGESLMEARLAAEKIAANLGLIVATLRNTKRNVRKHLLSTSFFHHAARGDYGPFEPMTHIVKKNAAPELGDDQLADGYVAAGAAQGFEAPPDATPYFMTEVTPPPGPGVGNAAVPLPHVIFMANGNVATSTVPPPVVAQAAPNGA